MEAAAEQLVQIRESKLQKRRFTFTLNNYTEDSFVNLQNRANEIFKYLIIGREVGESGTPHLQMYGELSNKITINGLKRKLIALDPALGSIHIEVAIADASSNIAYCSKDSNFVEIGNRPLGQGKRSDIDDVANAVKAGQSLSEIIENHGASYIKFSNGIKSLFMHYQKPRNFMTIGYWLSGDTGTGKSRWAHEKFPTAFWKAADTKWFDGYLGEETIIFDDYRPTKEISFQMILRMVDRYPMKVEVKGTYVNFAPKRIIFTTPKPIQETFQHLEWLGEESIHQLKRRMPYQFHFDGTNLLLANLQLQEDPTQEETKSGTP